MTASILATAVAVQWLAFAVIMAGAWLAQQRSGNSGWVDAIWTVGLGVVGAAGALVPLTDEAVAERQVLVALLVAVWAARLGHSIIQRTLETEDDPRYAHLAQQWGAAAPRNMAALLQVQALASVPLLATYLVAAQRPGDGFLPGDVAGVIVLLVAVGGEGLADRQLARFRRRPESRGRVCDVGLWRWSRHPNYFFQWLGWLAFPLIAIDVGGDYAWGWLALAGPLCMYVLLVHVSGIPPLEEHMVRSRGDAYRAYQSRTSAFFPLPPSRQAGDIT